MSIAMSIFNLFKRKHPQHNHEFTDTDREESAEKRRMAALMKKQNDILAEELEHMQSLSRQRQMQEKINHLKEMLIEEDDDDYIEPDDPTDELLKTGALMLMQRMQQQQPQQQQQQQPQSQGLTDEQIKQIIGKIPSKTITIAKSLDDDTLKRAVISYAPNIDARTIDRAIVLLRET